MDDLQRMLAIEEIKQLKYRYLRFLDTKEWDALAELFLEDATSAYGDGKYAFEGREAIMTFLRDALGRPSILTAHHVKQNGQWRFLSTGYQRTYEEMEPRPADGPIRLTANRFAEDS